MTDEQLLANAVRCARANRGGKGALRFVAVMDTFLCGSTTAKNLCERFGFDPYLPLRGQDWPQH